MPSYDSIKAETGKNDMTGDPKDQSLLTNKKVARATDLMTPSPAGLGKMLKTSAVKIRKKRGHT